MYVHVSTLAVRTLRLTSKGEFKITDPYVCLVYGCDEGGSIVTNPDEMQAELERLRAENAALKKTSSRGLSLKVSQKGALSVYGLGRFPVTLYKEQWEKLLDMADDIRTFISANDSALKTKAPKGE